MDEVDRRILEISEDQLEGFQRDPVEEIARQAAIKPREAVKRIQGMMRAGIIRRVRQTLAPMALAPGALVAWKFLEKELKAAFDFMSERDPFTGHVVIRSGSDYRLWTTVKVPRKFSLERHCELLKEKTGAEDFKIMRARGIFRQSVGHMRRKNLPIGAREDAPVPMKEVQDVKLNDKEWQILKILKKEFAPEEIQPDLWCSRLRGTEIGFEDFCHAAEQLAQKGVLGKFSAFLEHRRPVAENFFITRANGLFQWSVPRGTEEKAGSEIARFAVLTHCYWRDALPEFHHANIMAMAHGPDEETVLQHKAAIDQHLAQVKIPVTHTTVFWSERSEIKPSEIDVEVYRRWLNHIEGKC